MEGPSHGTEFMTHVIDEFLRKESSQWDFCSLTPKYILVLENLESKELKSKEREHHTQSIAWTEALCKLVLQRTYHQSISSGIRWL